MSRTGVSRAVAQLKLLCDIGVWSQRRWRGIPLGIVVLPWHICVVRCAHHAPGILFVFGVWYSHLFTWFATRPRFARPRKLITLTSENATLCSSPPARRLACILRCCVTISLGWDWSFLHVTQPIQTCLTCTDLRRAQICLVYAGLDWLSAMSERSIPASWNGSRATPLGFWPPAKSPGAWHAIAFLLFREAFFDIKMRSSYALTNDNGMHSSLWKWALSTGNDIILNRNRANSNHNAILLKMILSPEWSPEHG